MSIVGNLEKQKERLKKICSEKDVDYVSLNQLLDSVRIKRIKRNNYHQQKIADIIENATK